MELKSIKKSFEESIKDYNVKEKSKHWKKRFGLTKKLYNLKNLKNFRNNNLSDNLDDKHPFENQKKNFKIIIYFLKIIDLLQPIFMLYYYIVYFIR